MYFSLMTKIIQVKNCNVEIVFTFQVIHRLHTLHLAEELHHTGWNACSSCHDNPNRSRNRLIVPGILSNRIYVIDTETDPRKPKIDKVRIIYD